MSALFGTKEIDILNRRLGERLGLVDGRMPRFKWLWAPDQPWMVFSRDDQTLVKKCWGDMAAPDGAVVGRAWVLAQWKRSTVFDHHGFGSICAECSGEGYRSYSLHGRIRCQSCDGKGRITVMRIPFVREWDYAPHLETIIGHGQVPTAELTANYCWALTDMMEKAEKKDAYEQRMGDEAWIGQKNAERDKIANRERSMAIYDDNVGAFGNCLPGTAGGFMSFGGVNEARPVPFQPDLADTGS